MAMIIWKIKKMLKFNNFTFYKNVGNTAVSAGLITAICAIFLFIFELERGTINTMLAVTFISSFIAMYRL
jgi:hypothetical protein